MRAFYLLRGTCAAMCAQVDRALGLLIPKPRKPWIDRIFSSPHHHSCSWFDAEKQRGSCCHARANTRPVLLSNLHDRRHTASVPRTLTLRRNPPGRPLVRTASARIDTAPCDCHHHRRQGALRWRWLGVGVADSGSPLRGPRVTGGLCGVHLRALGGRLGGSPFASRRLLLHSSQPGRCLGRRGRSSTGAVQPPQPGLSKPGVVTFDWMIFFPWVVEAEGEASSSRTAQADAGRESVGCRLKAKTREKKVQLSESTF